MPSSSWILPLINDLGCITQYTEVLDNDLEACHYHEKCTVVSMSLMLSLELLITR